MKFINLILEDVIHSIFFYQDTYIGGFIEIFFHKHNQYGESYVKVCHFFSSDYYVVVKQTDLFSSL